MQVIILAYGIWHALNFEYLQNILEKSFSISTCYLKTATQAMHPVGILLQS